MPARSEPAAAGPRRLARAAGLALALGLGGNAAAQVATDGTVGPQRDLPGPDYLIGADLGTRAGDNLFHSFSRFSLATGERATFSGPAGIDNVIARVTGGAPSNIDGELRSSITGADLYFINPAGVLFGPNATLNVPGSFHVSTADELRFADGEVFSARLPDASSFSVAAPEAFGFLASAPAALTVDRSKLEVPAGESLTLSGGALTVNGDPDQVSPGLLFGRYLNAPGGRIVVAALGENGTLAPASGTTTGATGSVRIEDAAFVGTDGGSGGSIVIAGGDLTVDHSLVTAINTSATDAPGGVELRAAGTLRVTDSIVRTRTLGAGGAGAVDVSADRLVIDGSQIDASTFGLGPSGKVTIDTSGRIDIGGTPEGLLFGTGGTERAGVFSNGRFFGSGGRIRVDAPALVMTDGAQLDAGTVGAAPGGKIVLTLGRLALTAGAQAAVATEGSGAAGKLEIHATDRVEMSGPNTTSPRSVGDRSGLLASSGFLFASGGRLGDGGTVLIDTPLLMLGDRALIEAGTWTTNAGRSGTITIDAGTVELADGSQIGTSARGIGAAPGGDLTIRADRIRARGTGVASNGEELRSGIFGAAINSPAGDLVLVTRELIINGGRITSNTESTVDASTIRISAPPGGEVRLVIRNEGQIFAGTDAGGNGADIVIEGGGTIEITGTSDAELASPDVSPDDRGTSPTGIFSNVKRNGTGNGGDIVIGARQLLMRQGAAVSGQTLGTGAAGAIAISLADRATIDDSVVETAAVSTAPTSGGQVAIRAGRLIDLNRAEITTNGVRPAPGSSILTLTAPLVAINRSTVTSLTADGELLGSGVVTITGDPLLISTDSLVAATSSLELSGVDEELGAKLVVLPVGFLDAGALLRERCAARRDVGASSFTGTGRGGLPPSPDQPLGSAYQPPAESTTVRPAALVIPCSDAP